MKLVESLDGWEATLRPAGPGRYGGVFFLTLWLGFWAAGEILVGGILIKGGWALVAGRPLSTGQGSLETGPALATGLFLLGWLAFWTLGGVLAGQEWLRLLCGRDRLVVRGDGLEVQRRYGLFRTRQFFARDNIIRFYRLAPANTLKVETKEGTSEVTRMGTSENRLALESSLNALFPPTATTADTGVLPPDWRELTTPEGTQIIAADPAVRRKYAHYVGIIVLPFALTAFYLNAGIRTQPTHATLFWIVLVLAIALGWLATTLYRSRHEWALGRGQVVLQRRAGQTVTVKFTATTLKLTETSDSDGDPWFRLVAVAADAPVSLPPRRSRKFERVVYSATGDPVEVRNFGVWLARRCQVPFADHATAQAKTQEISELTRQLAATGWFGKWAARLLDRGQPPPG